MFDVLHQTFDARTECPFGLLKAYDLFNSRYKTNGKIVSQIWKSETAWKSIWLIHTTQMSKNSHGYFLLLYFYA
jgi:hypothetical protein